MAHCGLLLFQRDTGEQEALTEPWVTADTFRLGTAKRGLEPEQKGSRVLRGLEPRPRAWACHHQCLLLFPAHVLTDKGEKQNLSAAMGRGQEKKHLRRLRVPPRMAAACPNTLEKARGTQVPLPLSTSAPPCMRSASSTQAQKLNHRFWPTCSETGSGETRL